MRSNKDLYILCWKISNYLCDCCYF